MTAERFDDVPGPTIFFSDDRPSSTVFSLERDLDWLGKDWLSLERFGRAALYSTVPWKPRTPRYVEYILRYLPTYSLILPNARYLGSLPTTYQKRSTMHTSSYVDNRTIILF